MTITPDDELDLLFQFHAAISEDEFLAAFITTEKLGHDAATAFRHLLNGGRDTMALSTAANGTRWRLVTGRNPCSFCAMLATRSDYRTKEAAEFVVGCARGYDTRTARRPARSPMAASWV